MPYCTRNGVKTYYEVSGEGYPFVLMHANPFDRRLFLYQVAHLSTHFKMINIDLRGYGYSDKPSVPVTVTDLCEDVVAVCHQEGAREAIFAGVSVGGVMGLQLGLDYPELFKALILVGCSSMPGDRYPSRIDVHEARRREISYSTSDRSCQQGFCAKPTGPVSARHAHRDGCTLERARHRRDIPRTAESRFDGAIA
jgi:pimeloyl-ACP methyl ester carboxylesterase